MQRVSRGLVLRLLVAVVISLLSFGASSPFILTPALAATSTSFSPTSVNLTAGQSTTITIAAVGLAAGDIAAQFAIVHNSANTTISNPLCVGIFAGANANQAPQANGDLLVCSFFTGAASGTTGNVMTFTLTNTGGAAETILFNPAAASSTAIRGGAGAPSCPPLAGDINCDGIVEIRDYGIWRQNFLQTNCGNPADLDGNCIVDDRDYGVWRQNIGHTTGALATTFYLTSAFTVDTTGTLNTLTVTPTAGILGDFNRDGFVDVRDYGVWRGNFGQTNCGNPADADNNCLVDIRDYGIWRQHFGEGTPADRRVGAGMNPHPAPQPGRVQS